MDYEASSKRRLYGTLSWVIVGLSLILNYGMLTSDTSFQTRIIVIPLVNAILIIAWFYVRTLYNTLNSKLKHEKQMELRPEEKPAPSYRRGSGEAYTPNLTIATHLFESLGTEPSKSVLLDISLKDYLKPGGIIIFHDELNYGLLKKVMVLKVNTNEHEIEAFFTEPNSISVSYTHLTLPTKRIV